LCNFQADMMGGLWQRCRWCFVDDG
jgi:hypothetical protein